MSENEKWVQMSDNVFEDLGFDKEEAAVLKVKAELMIEIEKAIDGMNQTAAAKHLDISRPRLNQMLKGRFNGVTIDKMVQMTGRTGRTVTVNVRKKSRKAVA
jgi:predicted XRE-type DNA-binding protein